MVVVETGCGASAAPPMGPQEAMAMPAPPRAGAAPAAEMAPSTAPMAPVAPGAPKPAPLASDAKTAAPARAADTKAAKNAGPTARAPVIVYQGDLKMMSDEDAIPKTIDRIIDVAESVGGHIASRKDQSVQIKVPSASFRDAMTRIEALGSVVNRSVTADDVSEEFHDLEVRLVNLRATRARLQEFLAKAPGINDMLTVERELERVAQEIDKSEGRLEFLRTRAAMSAISVALTPKPKPVTPIVADKTPQPPPGLRTVDLPIPWLGEIGIDPLLTLKK